jgi:carnitine 3-dehydrogenase
VADDTEKIKTIGVIGTGVIGTGWVARFLSNGYQVKVWDPAEGSYTKLFSNIERLWPTLVKSGLSKSASLGNMVQADSLEAACDGVELVQENVPEDLEIKKTTHKAIDDAASITTIVSSSSSGLLPSDIQKIYAHPERMLIAHPFNPVYLLPLVELVPGKATSQATLDRARSFYAGLKMHPLVVRKEIEGYLSDRLQEALWREILHLVNDDIATTGELDDAIIYGPGLRWAMMGTCLTFHLAGGDNGMAHMLEQFGPALKLPWTHLEAPELTDELIEKMVDGTQAQANGRSVAELEQLRDSCLIEVMAALNKFQIGAGKLIHKG